MDQRVSKDEAENAYRFVPSAPPQVSRRWLLRIGVVITVGALLAAAWALLSGHRAAAQLREATEAEAAVIAAEAFFEPEAADAARAREGGEAEAEAPAPADDKA